MNYREGNYNATVIAQAFGESREKGTPYFALTIRPDEFNSGEPEMEPVSGQERTIWMYLTEGTAEFVARDLRTVGFVGSSFSDLDPANEKHHSLVGNRIPVYCKHEDYKGQTKEKWQISSGGGKIEHKPIDNKSMRKLDALFGKHLKAAKPANGQAAAAARSPAPALKDDDIPF